MNIHTTVCFQIILIISVKSTLTLRYITFFAGLVCSHIYHPDFYLPKFSCVIDLIVTMKNGHIFINI